MNSKRLDWIDSYKGILISMVILGHMSSDLPFIKLFQEMFLSMRMPAFFFISGYLFSRRYTVFSHFFKHKFRAIVVPYIYFYFFTVLIWQLAYFIFDKELMTIQNQVTAMLYGISSAEMLTASSLWFVLALFVTEVYFFFIKKYTKSDFTFMFFLILSAIFGYILITNLDFRIPWSADIAFFAVGFFGLGYQAKIHELFHKVDVPVLTKSVIIVLLVSMSIYFSLNSYVSFSKGKFENYSFMYLGAITGIISLVLISEFNFIKRSKVLQYIGANTYIILAFHKIPIAVVSVILFKLLNIALPVDNFIRFFVGVIYFSLVLAILVLIIEFFNRLLPFILNRPSNE